MLPFLSQVVSVPELFLVSVQLTHDKTGAQHLHIARDDSNNVFRYKLDAIHLVSFKLFRTCISICSLKFSRQETTPFLSEIRNY